MTTEALDGCAERSERRHPRAHGRGGAGARRGGGRPAVRRPLLRAVPVAMTLPGVLLFAACTSGTDGGDAPSAQKAAPEAAAADWQVLFDGTDLSRWRGYRQDTVPAAWRIEDGGVLALVPRPGREGEATLITRERYGDFELELDWRISEGGNSGIFYRATEDYARIYESGPEMQIVDNAGHPDGKAPITSAGSNFALYAPTSDVTHPAGEWNHVRIVARGPHVEHWLNGTKIVEYEQWSDDWKARVADSKFAAMPGYGKSPTGYIGLQDHGNPVWFRDIRIRRLDAGH